MQNKKIYVFTGLLLMAVFLSACTSAKAEQYLYDNYNKKFTALNTKHSSDYSVTYLESKERPYLFVKVIKNSDGSFVDDYDYSNLKYEFSENIQDIVSKYFDNSFVITTDYGITVYDVKTLDDLSKNQSWGLSTAIFIDENEIDDDKLIELTKEIKNQHYNARGMFYFISTDSIKQIQKWYKYYLNINNLKVDDHIIKTSRAYTFSYLPLPTFIVTDGTEYNMPDKNTLWKK